MEIKFTAEEVEILKKAQKELDREKEPTEDFIKDYLIAHLRQLLPDIPDIYRDIIEIKEDVSESTLEEIKRICIAAHVNRAGEVKLTPISKYKFCFEGTEKDYGCLQLGYLALCKIELFMDSVKSWWWEDEDPDESCDILKSLAIQVIV